MIESYVATGKAKLVYRHLLQLGDGSVRTAEASECAADQGQFWPMHGMLYHRQDEVYAADDLDTALVGFARDLKLDTAAFTDCMTTNKHLAEVMADYRASQAEGIRSRPVFDINGRQFIGAQPFAVFQQAIEEALPK